MSAQGNALGNQPHDEMSPKVGAPKTTSRRFRRLGQRSIRLRYPSNFELWAKRGPAFKQSLPRMNRPFRAWGNGMLDSQGVALGWYEFAPLELRNIERRAKPCAIPPLPHPRTSGPRRQRDAAAPWAPASRVRARLRRRGCLSQCTKAKTSQNRTGVCCRMTATRILITCKTT